MAKAPDLDLIGPIISAPDDKQAELYSAELEAYSSADEVDDQAYARRERLAFLVRELKQIDEIVKSRKEYANKIFLLVVWWLVCLGAMLLLAGFKCFGFSLDTKVLLTLIGGTTLNVLGIFTIVANFLFPKNGHSILSKAAGEKGKEAPLKPATQRARKSPPKSEDGPTASA